MMFSYPYFNYPYYRRYPSYPYSYMNGNKTSSQYAKNNLNDYPKKKQEEKKRPTKKQEEDSKIKQEDRGQCFDILGIRLYFDDILLICLIFFLYKEGVEDQSLFISLILLLLS